jgi:hypothetical protein
VAQLSKQAKRIDSVLGENQSVKAGYVAKFVVSVAAVETHGRMCNGFQGDEANTTSSAKVFVVLLKTN